MSEIVHNERCSHLSALLAPIAALVPLSDAFWINTPDGDLGPEWCHGCGRAMVRHLRRRDRKHRADYWLDGGWRTDHDGPRFCEGCGSPLDGALTRYGALAELEHYETWGVWPGRRQEALRIMEMLDALEYADEVDAEHAEAAADVAEAYLWSCV